MASTSSKAIFCYIHTRGRFVKDLEGKMQYEGGTAHAKLIREGMNYQDLSTMVSSLIGTHSDGKLKFTVKFNCDIYIDLVDDDGVEQLINFNDDVAHVYVVEEVDDSSSRTSAASPSSEDLQASSYEGEDGVIWLLLKLEGNGSGAVLERRDYTTINGNKSDEDFIQWYVFLSWPSESSEFIQANEHLKNVFSLPSDPSTINVFQRSPQDSDDRDKEIKSKRITHNMALNDRSILQCFQRFELATRVEHKLGEHGRNKDLNLLKDTSKIISNRDSTLTNNAIFEQHTTLGNTVLHLAASYGNHAMVEKVAEHAPHLFTVVNHNNDTALHVAARTGHGSTIKFLLNKFLLFVRHVTNGCGHQSSLEMMLMVSLTLFRNRQGNTFLHEALMIGSKNGAMIFKAFEDPFIIDGSSEFEARFKRIVNRLATFAVNVEEKSLLYLAIEVNCKEVVDKLMDFIIEGELKPQGKSPVLPTLINNNLDMLRTVLSKKPDWVHLSYRNGWFPLHCAALLGYFQGVTFLVQKCPSCTMERDNNGLLPLHLACVRGHVKIVQELLKWYLDPVEMLDQNGRNLLHYACESGNYEVVKYFLKHPKLEIMINQKDNNGDTPLLLASKLGHPKVVLALTWDNRVNLSLLNHHNLTALDVAEDWQGISIPSLSQRLTWYALKSAGAPQSFVTFYRDHDDGARYGTDTTEKYRDRIDTLLLVSTLIITTSFAAGFTVPGDQDQGIPVLLNRHVFHLFILSLTIAMFSAIGTTIILMWARLGDLRLARFCLKSAMPLLSLSLTTLSLAFLAGMYLIVSKLSWLATTFIGMCVVLMLMVVFLFSLLFLPSPSALPCFRYISYYPFLFFANIAEAKMDASNKQRSTSIIPYYNG